VKNKPAAYAEIIEDRRFTDSNALGPLLQALREMYESEDRRTDSMLVDGGFALGWATYALFRQKVDGVLTNRASAILWRLEYEAKALESRIVLRHDLDYGRRWFERLWFFRTTRLLVVRAGGKHTPPTPPLIPPKKRIPPWQTQPTKPAA
jgi:hypothetical protein